MLINLFASLSLCTPTTKYIHRRKFRTEEQSRFDKLQDEYQNLRWHNLLNLGYDPATAATMVGATKDAGGNFNPPPLFALSPRMIVKDDSRREKMRRVLIEYLEDKAEEAERELLEELEKEMEGHGGGAGNNNNTKKVGKKAKKKAKKKKKKLAGKQQQQQQTTQQQTQQSSQQQEASSDQTPLNKEQLRYLREYHQQQSKTAYSEDDRKIIEDALKRNGLSTSLSEDTEGGAKGNSDEGDVDKKGKEDSGGDKEKEAQPLKYEEEVQNYAYAWCCDYCKTATFPTFAEAALHESKCEAYLLAMEKDEQKDRERECATTKGGKVVENENGGEGGEITNADGAEKIEEGDTKVDVVEDGGERDQTESPDIKSDDTTKSSGSTDDSEDRQDSQEENEPNLDEKGAKGVDDSSARVVDVNRKDNSNESEHSDPNVEENDVTAAEFNEAALVLESLKFVEVSSPPPTESDANSEEWMPAPSKNRKGARHGGGHRSRPAGIGAPALVRGRRGARGTRGRGAAEPASLSRDGGRARGDGGRARDIAAGPEAHEQAPHEARARARRPGGW